MNEAYRSCLSASEAVLPSHPWQSVLTQSQTIALPPRTLPGCSDTVPARTPAPSQGKAERNDGQVLCITVWDGMAGEGFSCPVVGQSAPQVDDCSSAIN